MKAPRIILFLLMFSVFSIFSQEIKLYGIVNNESGKPLSNILISVLSNENNTLAYQYSNNEGEFNFVLNDIPSPLYIEVSSLFYETHEVEVDLLKNEKMVFILKSKIEVLDEVVVTSSKFSNDTINLGIRKYNIKGTENIEKSLKKIPGISIDKDGRIKYWNKEIEKILIDGDDLANDQYTFISKNLRSEVLDDIQVLKNFEENTVFKKTRESNKIALNLKIKEKFKNIWFGNVSAGYGNSLSSEDEFSGSSNLGLLKKKIKFLNSQKLSTLGDKSIPVFLGNNEHQNNNNPLYSIRKVDVPLTAAVTNFNNAFSNTFLINKKFKNTVLRSTNFIGIDNQKQESFKKTNFFFQDDSLLETNRNKDRKTLLFGELEIKQLNLENNFFVNTFKYKVGLNNASSFSIFDANETSDFNENKEFSFYDHFQHTYRFKNGIVLNNEIDLVLSALDETTTINSENLKSFFQTDSLINQNADKFLRYISVKTDASYFFTRKLKSNLLFNFKNSEERFDIILTPENSIDGNNVIYNRNQFIIRPSFIYNFSRKVKFKGAFSSNFFRLNNVNTMLLNYDATLNFKFWGDIELSYLRKQEFPTNQNFLQNYYFFENNTLKRGGLFFVPLDYDLMRLKINSKDKKNTFNNEISVSYNRSKSSLLEDYSLLNNINFNSTFLISQKGENLIFKDQLIFLVKSLGFKLETTQSYASIPLNNENGSLTKVYNGLYDFELTSYFSSSFNFNLKFEYNENIQTFNDNKSSFDSKNFVLDLDWDINKEFSLGVNGGVYELDKSYYKIFNTSIDYLPKTSNFSYSLSFNNLLNEDEFLFQQRNSFFTSITAIPLVPFYAFASVKYIF